MTAENTLEVLKHANRLPSPPGVAMRILQLVESEDASMEDLAQAISGDPALTAKILKFVNSPLVGMTFQGTTLLEAVSRIGMRGARMLALSFSLVSQEHRSTCPSFDLDGFWSESLARAVAARSIAKAIGGIDADEAFITALLCRIGKLVYATGMPKEYDAVLSGSVLPDLSLEERERSVLGSDHLSISVALLRQWQLPASVTASVEAFGASANEQMTQVISLADAVAALLGGGMRQDAEALELVCSSASEPLGLDNMQVRTLLPQIAKEWESYGQLLAVPTSKIPDFDEIEREAEEKRTMLRLASEMEVQSLRSENEQLSHLANRDRLTGLFNRGAFDEALAKALETSAEEDRSVTLLMIDVDCFKSINDDLGHQTGDEVLRHIARILNDNVRKRDEVYRYGGEEFVVIALDSLGKNAEVLAEGLRAAIEANSFVHQDTMIKLTASIGVGTAHWPERPMSPGELIEYADLRLYEAKRGGRNTWRANPESAAEVRDQKGLFSRIGRLFAS